MRIPTPPKVDPNAKKMPKWKPPRFDFTGGKKKLVRPKRTQFAHNSVEMLADSGLNVKYVHAIGHGQEDLRSCRETLVKQGE